MLLDLYVAEKLTAFRQAEWERRNRLVHPGECIDAETAAKERRTAVRPLASVGRWFGRIRTARKTK